jgi:predicted ATPase/DNA-binding winged helix-turn-helix (wHTH) protein
LIYRFDDCELDERRVVLRRGGEEVPVEPQVFDVLRCLIERRGQLVSKEELLDEVWGSRFVSESALTSRIKSARRAVGDDGTRQHVIRTVHGKGYEFVADVAPVTGADEPDPSPGANPERAIGSGSGETDEAGDDARPFTVSAPQPTLPLPLNALIGRDDLLDELSNDLSQSRLLTIVGTAGVGKTSVGLELARRAAGGRRDGVFLVELVGVGDGEGALAAIATALDVNIRQQTSLETAIVDMLRARDLLLLIDNCEHLVEPVAALVEQILRTAPDVTIVATSREPLAIARERVHFVEPLDVGDLGELDLADLAATPAVALFAERARAVDARFELTEETAPAVVEICRRLDGIPLALELAASRIHAIDAHELAQRLDERLRLLRAVRRGADPRHSTLFDAISWSYDLLDTDEQRLFTKLAVFAGAFDLEAAESVCDDEDVLDLITRLSQRSMVAVRRHGPGDTRYELLETLREFGRSRLDDLDNVALFQAHAHHFATLAESVASLLESPDEAVGIQRAAGAFADLRAAQRFALQAGDVDTGLRLITGIREFAQRHLRYEVFSWADAAAGMAADHPLAATLLALRGYGAFVRGEFEEALALADAAAGLAHDSSAAVAGLVERVRANASYLLGDVAAGRAACATMITAADESGNPSQQAHANYMASIAASSEGDDDLARERFEAAFDAAHRSGCPTDLAAAWTARGFACGDDDEAALDAFASADRLARSAGNRWMSAFAGTEASVLRVANGDLTRGCEGLAETVDIWYRAGEWAQQWLTLTRCVVALDRIGCPEMAAEVYGAIEGHTSVEVPPVTTTVRDLALATRQSIETQLGTARTEDLLTVGAHQPLTTLVHRTRNALLGFPDDR